MALNEFEQRSISTLVWIFLREAISQEGEFQEDLNYWVDSIDEETPEEILDYIMANLKDNLLEHFIEMYALADIIDYVQAYLGDDFEEVFLYGMVSRVLLEYASEQEDES